MLSVSSIARTQLSSFNVNRSQNKSQPRFNVTSSPSWDGVLTRTEPEMTDEEFHAKIKEMSINNVKMGRAIYDMPNAFSELRDSFISVVSPDRESIINNRL